VQSLNDQADAIQTLLRYVSDHAYQFFTAIAAVGVFSMAIIQTIKDMLPVRNWFQQFYVRRWMQQKANDSHNETVDWLKGGGFEWFAEERARTDPRADLAKFEKGPDWAVAERDLFKLATDGDDKALYDLPIEQLCGQINAAAQVVLDRPADHPDLMLCLASVADPVDIARVMFPPAEAKAARPLDDDEARRRHDSFVDARTRVTHQVQRAIDALQISAGFRWKFGLQVISIVLSGVIAAIGVWKFAPGAGLSTVVVIGVMGGFLAPVARDLVAALQQLRK
jgi:hypothetical protein